MNVPMWWGKPDKKKNCSPLKCVNVSGQSRERHYRPAREGNYLRIWNQLKSKAKSIQTTQTHRDANFTSSPNIFVQYVYLSRTQTDVSLSHGRCRHQHQLCLRFNSFSNCRNCCAASFRVNIEYSNRLFQGMSTVYFEIISGLFSKGFLGGCDLWKHDLRLWIWISRLKSYEIECSKGWKTWILKIGIFILRIYRKLWQICGCLIQVLYIFSLMFPGCCEAPFMAMVSVCWRQLEVTSSWAPVLN